MSPWPVRESVPDCLVRCGAMCGGPMRYGVLRTADSSGGEDVVQGIQDLVGGPGQLHFEEGVGAGQDQ